MLSRFGEWDFFPVSILESISRQFMLRRRRESGWNESVLRQFLPEKWSRMKFTFPGWPMDAKVGPIAVIFCNFFPQCFEKVDGLLGNHVFPRKFRGP